MTARSISFEDDYQRLMSEISGNQNDILDTANKNISSNSPNETAFSYTANESTALASQEPSFIDFIPEIDQNNPLILEDTEENLSVEIKDYEELFMKWQGRVTEMQVQAQNLFSRDGSGVELNPSSNPLEETIDDES